MAEDALYVGWKLVRVALEQTKLVIYDSEPWCVVLDGGFFVYVENSPFRFRLVGRRAELSLSAGSLAGRDKWVDKLQQLKCWIPLPIARSGSYFVDSRSCERATRVFASFLYVKEGWTWRRAYFLLLGEQGTIVMTSRALNDDEKNAMPYKLPSGATYKIRKLKSKFTVVTDQGDLVLHSPSDLKATWISKIKASLKYLQRSKQEEERFRIALRPITITGRTAGGRSALVETTALTSVLSLKAQLCAALAVANPARVTLLCCGVRLDKDDATLHDLRFTRHQTVFLILRP